MAKRKQPERRMQGTEPPLTAPQQQAEVWRPRHHRIAARLSDVLAGAGPDQAIAALSALSPVDGTARRAVRSAMIAALRAAVQERPAPQPVPEPDPLPVEDSLPPQPPKAGVLNTLALDQAARMLLAAADEEDGAQEPAEEPPDQDSAVFTATPLAALASDGLSPPDDTAPAPTEPKPKRRKKAAEPASVAALLDDPAELAPLSVDVTATLTALEAADFSAALKKPPVLDLSAQFAAMEGPDGD